MFLRHSSSFKQLVDIHLQIMELQVQIKVSCQELDC